MNDLEPMTVSTWSEFQRRWDGVHNFLMTGECLPFAFEMPSIDRVVAEMRGDELARITPGTRGVKQDLTDIAAAFRALPIEEALERPFALGHFRLSRFDAPGRFLHGFEEQVLTPWKKALTAAGFTFERCYPIIFISGKGCSTNYHMDLSHVLAWQIHGHKRFCGLKDPERWAPREQRVNCKARNFVKPTALTEDDALCYEMGPGDLLWNAFLTPHWVDAGDEVAMSVNISHGGLRFDGKLCQHEVELREFQTAEPEIAPENPVGAY